ncbi:MAG TPA: hypothetical protein VNZ50_12625 [Hyphomicrobiaceae bacterium]|nr:hypothetical protein [Hyphomicrobiaceae bacterium]
MDQTRVRDDEFLGPLAAAAALAQREEIDFRDNVGREIEKRERARQYAFRRLSIAELMLKAARQAEDVETAVASQTAALRAEFGWNGEGEASRKIVVAWRPVALAIWEAVKPPPQAADAASPPPAPDIVAALTEFERWYEAEFGANYLAILDQEKLEYPVVEF